MTTDPMTCDGCGEVLEEGYTSPGRQSPDAAKRYCCQTCRKADYAKTHPEASPEDVFVEDSSDTWHPIVEYPGPSREW